MFKNYLLTTYRNIVKYKFYSGLIILGLSIGLITSIFILIYVKDEISYDKYNEHKDRIYRLESHFVIDGKDERFAVVSIPLAPTLKDEFPEIIDYVRFSNAGTQFYKFDDIEFSCDSIYFVDSTVFDIFSHKFIHGSPKNALNRPYTMVLTNSLAQRLFGCDNPIGKTIKTVDDKLYEITAVIENVPGNSHLKFKALISAMTFAEDIGIDRMNDRSAGAFWNIGVYSYVLMENNATLQSVIDKFPAIYDKYMSEIGDQINASFSLKGKPLVDLHLKSGDLLGELPTGNMNYIYIMLVVAVFIILIASINYMNMSTARSFARAREVGMRKTVGATKEYLILQFMGESILLSIIALFISLILLPFVLPLFNEIAGKSFELTHFFKWETIAGVIAIVALVGILSGVYPAFYLSSFKTTRVLKGKPEIGDGSGSLRKVLVVFQFIMSVVAIIGTLVVSGQLNYLKNKNLGFDKENIILIETRDTTFKKSLNTFKEQILKHPDVISCALSSSTPGYGHGIQVMRVEGSDEQLVEKAINNYYVDYDYIDMMGIEIKKGRNYDETMGTDEEKAFIINEAAAEFLGWGDDALGKRFQFGINLDGTSRRDGQIVGVIKDYHYHSLHSKVDPLVLIINSEPDFNFLVSIRTNGKNDKEVIKYIKEKRAAFNPVYPFEHEYLTNRLDNFYKQEETISQLSKVAVFLIIIIASLGLLGLSSFIAQQKTKEIGIRKVVGAMMGNILWIFVKEFSKWVIIANVVAWLAGYYFMNRWLQSFEFHMDLTLSIFIISLIISLLVALVTITWQSVKVSLTNPSIILKYE